MQNSNATLILIFGVLSLCGFWILGPVAWIMGNNSLAAIDSGQADPSERQLVAAGRICGMVSTLLMAVAIVGFMLFLGGVLGIGLLTT